ncbi:MAG: Rieske (2Fe-2S) protein [bacterium]|nr:MAG: Rieske (2Fe-2S) protein [bacterium]
MSEIIKNNTEDNLNRRKFLNRLVFSLLGGTGILTLLGSLTLPFPRVFKESFRFKVGRVIDFPVDTFTFIPEKNVFILRQRKSIQALSAACTHLGCVVQSDRQGFLCPCHGSRYDRTGNVQYGPAPRALDWLKVTLAADGQIVVHRNQKVNSVESLRV